MRKVCGEESGKATENSVESGRDGAFPEVRSERAIDAPEMSSRLCSRSERDII